jgi:hypothetical protein
MIANLNNRTECLLRLILSSQVDVLEVPDAVNSERKFECTVRRSHDSEAHDSQAVFHYELS